MGNFDQFVKWRSRTMVISIVPFPQYQDITYKLTICKIKESLCYDSLILYCLELLSLTLAHCPTVRTDHLYTCNGCIIHIFENQNEWKTIDLWHFTKHSYRAIKFNEQSRSNGIICCYYENTIVAFQEKSNSLKVWALCWVKNMASFLRCIWFSKCVLRKT